MNKKNILKISFLIIALIFNFLIFKFGEFNNLENEDATLTISFYSDSQTDFQVYYASEGRDLSEEASVSASVKGGSETAVNLVFPYGSSIVRLDPSKSISKVEITAASLEVSGKKTDFSPEEFGNMLSECTDMEKSIEDGKLIINTLSEDSHAYINFDKEKLGTVFAQDYKTRNMIISIILCLVIDIIALYALKHFDALIDVPSEIYRNRKMAMTLSKNDFKTKYAGSYLGIIWAFIQPVTTILVYWFVFQVGFRSGNVKGVPFVVYLVSGIVPWFYFSDALNGGTAALTEYSYLVKKVVFNIDILPFIKVVSAIFVHIFFIVFSVILEIACGYYPSIHMIQLIYYIICSFIFSLGLSYLTSAIVVFFRDLTQFINIFVLQVGMWLTPIMWDENMLPGFLRTIFKLNPMFYIVDGFRDSMIYKKWVWDGKILWTIYFWVFTFLVFGLGTKIFRRLKIHFADVL